MTQHKPAFNLSGKRALVTGGTAGIGLAVAERFQKHGASVVISGRRPKGNETARRLGLHFVRADMTCEEDVVALFDEADQLLGGLDVIVNNAGRAHARGRITELDMSAFDDVFRLNVRAAYQVIRLGGGRLSEGGSIINTSSIAATEGGIGGAVYAASKAALLSLTKSAALEFARHGIRVNAVSPGFTQSEIWGGREPANLVRELVPVGRLAEADETAALFHFLAADESSYVTGANLLVDGGYLAGHFLRTAPSMG